MTSKFHFRDDQNRAPVLSTPLRTTMALAPVVAMLAACQTTQGLPTVNDAQRRPINNVVAIELQTCKAEASALRATLLESAAPQCSRLDAPARLVASPTMSTPAPMTSAASTASTASAAPAAAPAPSTGPSPAALSGTAAVKGARMAVFVFEQGQVALNADPATRDALKEAAHAAEVIHVRGRSGAMQESAADVLAARRRAESASSLLQELGVPPHKLRVSWHGLADAGAEAGQGRRVEIEFFERAPTVLFTRAAADKAAKGPALLAQGAQGREGRQGSGSTGPANTTGATSGTGDTGIGSTGAIAAGPAPAQSTARAAASF
jgi:hypothetical protein